VTKKVTSLPKHQIKIDSETLRGTQGSLARTTIWYYVWGYYHSWVPLATYPKRVSST